MVGHVEVRNLFRARSPWLPRQYAYVAAMGLRIDDSNATRSAKLLTSTVALYIMAHYILCAVIPFFPGVQPTLAAADARVLSAAHVVGLLLVVAGLAHYTSTGRIPLFRGLASSSILLTSATAAIVLRGAAPCQNIAVLAPFIALCTEQTMPFVALQAGAAVAVVLLGVGFETRPDLFFARNDTAEMPAWSDAAQVFVRAYCQLVPYGGSLVLTAYTMLPRQDIYPPHQVRSILNAHQARAVARRRSQIPLDLGEEGGVDMRRLGSLGTDGGEPGLDTPPPAGGRGGYYSHMRVQQGAHARPSIERGVGGCAGVGDVHTPPEALEDAGEGGADPALSLGDDDSEADDESGGGLRVSLKAMTGALSAVMFVCAGVLLTLLLRRVHESAATEREELAWHAAADSAAYAADAIGAAVSSTIYPHTLHTFLPNLSTAYAVWTVAEGGALGELHSVMPPGVQTAFAASIDAAVDYSTSAAMASEVPGMPYCAAAPAGGNATAAAVMVHTATEVTDAPVPGDDAPGDATAGAATTEAAALALKAGMMNGLAAETLLTPLADAAVVMTACRARGGGVPTAAAGEKLYIAAIPVAELAARYTDVSPRSAVVLVTGQRGHGPDAVRLASGPTVCLQRVNTSGGTPTALSVAVAQTAATSHGGEWFTYLVVWMVVFIGSCFVSLVGSFIFEPIYKFALRAHDFSNGELPLEELQLPTGGYSELIILKWAFTRLANTIIKAKMFLPIASLGALDEEGDEEGDVDKESEEEAEEDDEMRQYDAADIDAGARESTPPPALSVDPPEHAPAPHIQRVATPQGAGLSPQYAPLSSMQTASQSSAVRMGAASPSSSALTVSGGKPQLSKSSSAQLSTLGSPTNSTSGMHTPRARRLASTAAALERERERDEFLCLKRGPPSPNSPKSSHSGALRQLRRENSEIGRASNEANSPHPVRIRKAVRFTPETKVPHMTLTHNSAVLSMNVNSFHTIMKTFGKKSFDYFSDIFSSAMGVVGDFRGIPVSITGDRMLAVWNMRKVTKSCAAALKIHECMKQIGNRHGAVQIGVRVGIAGGRVTWGNFSLIQPGGRVCSIVNMLGQAVNKAVALERLNKQVFSSTLIEGALRDLVGEHPHVLFRPVEVVIFQHSRRAAPTPVFEILSFADPTAVEYASELPGWRHHLAAFNAVRDQDWEAAESELQSENMPVNPRISRLFMIVRGRRPPLEID